MITTTTLLVASFLVVPQDDGAKLDSAVAAMKIRAAIKEGSAPALETIKRFGEIPGKEVTAALALALRNKDQVVQLAAVRALRYNKNQSAFAELYRVRGKKAIMSEPELAAEYYLALGQHRDRKALPFLLKDLRARGRRDKVIGPRLLALGRIRERASIDGLIDFMRANRGSSREAVTSLVVLTGRNEGNKWVGWARWWKQNRARFKLPEDEPELGKRQARTWTKVWALPGSQPARDDNRKKKGEQEPDADADGSDGKRKATGGDKKGRGKRGRDRRKDERKRKKR